MVRPEVGTALQRDRMDVRPPLTGVMPSRHAELRTLWGLSLVGLGVGLAAVGVGLGFFGFAGAGYAWPWLLFAVLGFFFLGRQPGVHGPAHRRDVWVGTALAITAAAVGLSASVGIGDASSGMYSAYAAALHSELFLDSVFVLLGVGAVAVATFAVQDRLGHGLLFLAFVSACLLQPVIWVLVDGAISGALSNALATGSRQPLVDTVSAWARFGTLNAIPLALVLVAYERLYWQLRHRLPGLRLWEA